MPARVLLVLQVNELKEELRDAAARLLMAEENQLHQAKELHVLKGALGLKNNMADATLDSQAKLLHALAKVI